MKNLRYNNGVKEERAIKMEKSQVQLLAFQLIAHSGDALNHFNLAVDHAEEGNFEEAKQEISEGDKALIEAHKAQSEMLVSEARDEVIEYSVIMMHAQDHLMTTLNFERFAKRFISLYKKIMIKEKE